MFRFVVLLMFWVLLAGSIAWEEWVLGSVVSLLVVALLKPPSNRSASFYYTPQAVWALLRYLGLFMAALVRANLDMARRVLSPSLPIAPVMVDIQTSLQSGLGRLLLANSITLTPGTLTVDLKEDQLLIHWIDSGELELIEDREAYLRQATIQISERFEQAIGGFLR